MGIQTELLFTRLHSVVRFRYTPLHVLRAVINSTGRHNFQPIPLQHPPTTRFDREYVESDDELQPPHPIFVREHSGFRSNYLDSLESHESHEIDGEAHFSRRLKDGEYDFSDGESESRGSALTGR